MGLASVVMVGDIDPLGHHSGLHRQPGGVVVPVPLADTPDDHHNEETEHQGEDQKEQNFESAAEHKGVQKPHAAKAGRDHEDPTFSSC